MTFLNAILLGGLAAASIPVLIHLFNRNRFRTVKWGAMHLLDSAIKINKRRLKLEQLLLLLLRCCIPAVLALLMARPVLSGFDSLVGAAKTSLVVVLDNSYSMEYGGAASGNFHQAKEATGKIIDDLGRGSDVSVVLMAGGVSTLFDSPSFDLGRVSKETLALDAGFGSASVPESLEAAAGILAKMQHPFRELVVISDFQKVSWGESEAPARARVAELLSKMPIKPQLTLFHVGAEGRDNVSVDSLDFSRLVFGVRQPVQVRANLKNFGDRSYPDLKVYFRVDGKERAAAQISLGPNEERQVLFTHAFETAGSHFVEVLADADTLTADNSYSASIPVWDRVPVLLVNGDPNPAPLKGETDFLEIALQPFGVAKLDLTDLIAPRVVEARDLNAEVISKSRVVVLANVRQLTDAQVRALKDFVRDGGGLLIFPGDRLNVEWYNTTMTLDNGLLPLQMTSLAGALDDKVAPARIVASHYTHAALDMFNDPRNGNLADGEIKLWYKTRARPGDNTISILAQLDSGDPFLIEKKYGEGRVIQCTTPCDADWNNLPVRPFYLPLMQRLTTYLASTVFPPRNVDVGKPLLAFLPAAEAGKKALLIDPAGNKVELPIVGKGARSVVEFNQARRPGLYRLTTPDNTTIHFVVNTARTESDLKQLGESERQKVAQAMKAKLVNTHAEYKQLDQNRRFGREIWRPLLWALLALVFGELFLQQWFARRRS